MADGDGGLAALYRSALPSVPGEPVASLPAGLYRYIWRVSGPQQARLIALSALVFPLSMVPLELQRRIVNVAIEDRNLRLVALLGAVYLAVLLLHGGLKYVRNLYLGRTSEGVTRSLRRRIVRAMEEPGGTQLAEGARVSVVAAETERLGGFVGESLAEPVLQAGILLSVLGYMFVVEPLVAAIGFAFFAPSLLLVPALQRLINRLVERRMQLVRALGDKIAGEEGADAADGDEPPEAEPADRLIDRIYGARVRIFRLKYLMKFANNLLNNLGPLSVLVVGGWMVIHGQTQAGTIVAFISGFQRLSDPARQLLNLYRQASQMRVQYRLVREAAPPPDGQDEDAEDGVPG